jgi:PAS domain S-box-containing protein
VLGYTEEEYIGQPIMKFCPDEEELVLEIFKQLGSGNTIRDVPVRFRAKDGHIVHLLIDSNVKYDAQGKFAHTRCFIRDDTKRKIHEAKASLLLDETKRSLKMMDHFLSRSMHHMRTPLHILRHSADLVLDQLTAMIKVLQQPHMPIEDQKATVRELVQVSTNILSRCDVHVDSAVTMIDDVSDLARLDQGQQLVVAHEPVLLTQLLPQLIAQVDLLCDIMPKLVIDRSVPPIILSDNTSLRKVLQHLLEHLASVACSHNGGKNLGEIVLRVMSTDCHDGTRCCFETAHIGPAKISVDETMELDLDTTASAEASGLPAIFQRYHQEFIPDATTDWEEAKSLRDKIEAGVINHRENSIGIGLSLSYHIVAALGGDLRYSSDPAKGLTKFWFSLPAPSNATVLLKHVLMSAAIPDQPTKRRRIVNEDDTDGAKKMPAFSYTKADVASCGVTAMDPPTVLVVEDSAVCAKLLCRTLNKLNIPTKWVANGQEAIDLLKSSEGTGIFNLILMDLRMPVMDGIEATKIIKEELKLTIPVVALTGETSGDVKKRCAEIGFDEFRQKPMKVNDLINVVKEHTGYVFRMPSGICDH